MTLGGDARPKETKVAYFGAKFGNPQKNTKLPGVEFCVAFHSFIPTKRELSKLVVSPETKKKEPANYSSNAGVQGMFLI